jgi:hypothetical protein
LLSWCIMMIESSLRFERSFLPESGSDNNIVLLLPLPLELLVDSTLQSCCCKGKTEMLIDSKRTLVIRA